MDTRARNYDFQGSALPEVMQAGQDQVTMADNGESIDPNLVSVELSTSLPPRTLPPHFFTLTHASSDWAAECLTILVTQKGNRAE